jgi:hypothetical protein
VIRQPVVVGCALWLATGAAGAGGPTLSADTSKPSISTYSAGEPAQILFSIAGLASQQPATLDISIVDEYGRPTSPPIEAPLTTDEQGNARYQLSLATGKLGYYEVHARLADGTTLSALGTRPEGFISYAVVPDPARRVDYGDQGSRFGLQGGFNSSANILSYLGSRYVLQDGAGWAEQEPDYPGEFAIRRREARSRGLLLPEPNPASHSPPYNGKPWNTYYLTVVTRASMPPWATRRGSTGKICKTFGALNSSSEKSLTNFAAALAEAFRSDYRTQSRRYYQVTWEPADWCFGGSDTDLVKIYSLVYPAIHRADPDAIVAGPTLFLDAGSSAQLRQLWKAGLGRYIDALAVHPYTHFPPEADDGLRATLRLQRAEAALAIGHAIPVIGTEHGYPSATLGNLKKALGDIRATIMMLGEGASIDFGFYAADDWSGDDPGKSEGYGYYWNLNPRIIWGTDKMSPKVVVPAYAAMTYLLDGSTTDGPVADLGAGQVGYRFHRPDGSSIRVIWDPEGSSTYPVHSESLLCDWMGNCARPTGPNATATIGTATIGTVTIGAAPTYIVDEH